jgi:hypothetical protein
MPTPRKPDTRMPMSISLADYQRLPAEDKHDPGVIWHILIDDKFEQRCDVQRDYDRDGGTTFQNFEYGE